MSSKTFSFTDSRIRNLPPFKKKPGVSTRTDEYSDSEVRGLKLDVNDAGKKHFSLTYTIDGRRRSIAIGEFPGTNTKAARSRATEFRGLIDEGIDPHFEKELRRAMPLVREFAHDEYMVHAKASKLSFADDESRLDTHILPKIGALPLDAVRPKDIESVLNAMAEKKLANGTLNRVLSVMSRMFKLAIERGYLKETPCRFMRKRREAAFNPQLITPEELQRLMVELASARVVQAGAAIQLLFLTGARKQDLLNRRWVDYDPSLSRLFVIRTKNGEGQHIPLSQPAIDIIESLPRVPGSPYIFHSAFREHPAAPEKGLQPFPLQEVRKTFDTALRRAGLPHMRLHDARHVFGFLAINSGQSIYSVQRALNHKAIAMTMRYSRLKDTVVLDVANHVAKLAVPATPPKQHA